MGATATMLHILPGKTIACLDFTREALGPRLEQHSQSRRRLGITSEKAWIEATNKGDFLILYLEGDDLEKTFAALTQSREPYDVWFKERIFAVTGVDLEQPGALRPSELVYESPTPLIATRPGANSVATLFPVLPGQLENWKQWLDEMNGPRLDEYMGYLHRYGLTKERFFLKSGPEGDMVILYAEGSHPAEAIARFARSSHPFDAWMREEMLYLNGIDFIRRATAPKPSLVMDWSSEARLAA